ncbi:hypothetical protein B0I37DRAFT_184273 [Chaetomium sp. MPI-CAGE-AT-0009]|nr:hypothetical protein B0I37DRAFT_184273 [Chaetomium sp. MPI-CAGE-AT-0009]
MSMYVHREGVGFGFWWAHLGRAGHGSAGQARCRASFFLFFSLLAGTSTFSPSMNTFFLLVDIEMGWGGSCILSRWALGTWAFCHDLFPLGSPGIYLSSVRGPSLSAVFIEIAFAGWVGMPVGGVDILPCAFLLRSSTACILSTAGG